MNVFDSYMALFNQIGIDSSGLMSSVFLLTILQVVTAIPTGRIAKQKRRSRVLWILLALSIPLIPLLLVWLLPAIPEKEPTKMQ